METTNSHRNPGEVIGLPPPHLHASRNLTPRSNEGVVVLGVLAFVTMNQFNQVVGQLQAHKETLEALVAKEARNELPEGQHGNEDDRLREER